MAGLETRSFRDEPPVRWQERLYRFPFQRSLLASLEVREFESCPHAS